MITDVKMWDTVAIMPDRRYAKPKGGFTGPTLIVFSSMYPVSSDEEEEFADALEKLKINDASLIYEKDNSSALGLGYCYGFLGLLHLEVVQEKL